MRLAQVLGRDGKHPLALIGRDTRLSGAMIENALAAGLMAQGFDTLHVGIITTPGVAYLTRTLGARCGISISASHNPFDYNGIKVFGGDGFKIPDEAENGIEKIAYARRDDESHNAIGSIGQRRDDQSPITNYLIFFWMPFSANPSCAASVSSLIAITARRLNSRKKFSANLARTSSS